MAFLAGKNAAVLIGSISFRFDEWKVTLRNQLSKVTNFESQGYADYIDGITDGKITLSGPYDQGNMSFTVGSSYDLILTYISGTTLTVAALLESIDPDVKVEDAERVSLTFQSTGAFSAEIG